MCGIYGVRECKTADMRLDKFTQKAQEALQTAVQAAEEAGQQAAEPEHLLLALVPERQGISRALLEASGVSLPGLEAGLASAAKSLPRVQRGGQAFVSKLLTHV